MKSWGLAVVIVLFALAFIWMKGGVWLDAKAEAEKTQAKTTADLSKTMLLLSQAQAKADKRIDDQDKANFEFRNQVTREHTEAANTLRQLLTILTELVESIKNDRTPPQT
jgi:cytoskeletal protein RodZ